MGLKRTGLDPLAYLGVEPSSPSQFVIEEDNPNQNDWQNFNVGTIWLNTTTQVPWMLVSLARNQATWITLGGSTGHPLITTYSTPGTYTWTKASGTTWIQVYGISGGSGGGSGAREPSALSTGGGAGGAGGSFQSAFPDTYVGATEPVVVGAGGAGGAAITTDNTLGNDGVAGGTSSFGNVSLPGSDPVGGQGGQLFDGVVGDSAIALAGTINGLISTAIGSFTSIPAPGELDLYGFPAIGQGYGGSGNGATTGTAGRPGLPWQAGKGGDIGPNVIPTAAGGAAGTQSSPNGVNGQDAPSGSSAGGEFVYGAGGGGGFGQTSSSAPGIGGNGGFPGGGGGGGGGSLNGTASGAGGNGANGIVIVIEW